MPADDEIAAKILALLHARSPESSICPSDAARALARDWRPLMPRIRAVAIQMVEAGRIQVSQKGRIVDPRTARGAIRLRLPRGR